MKKVGAFKTFWLVVLSFAFTAKVCSKGLLKVLFGNFNPEWERKQVNHWSDQMLNLLKIKLKIINQENIHPRVGEPTIIMCNHSSLYDIPISFKAFPDTTIRMLSKKELSKIPIMGWSMKKIGYPFISRYNKAEAMTDLNNVKKLLNEGIVIWIAPEGTRSKDGKLHKFKKGGFITAIETKAKIIPMGIRGANQILPKKTFKACLGCEAQIYIGKPIDASKYTMDNKEELIEKVYQSMKKLVGEK